MYLSKEVKFLALKFCPALTSLLRSESASSRFLTGRCVGVKVKTESENKLETDTESQNLYSTCTNQTGILVFMNSRKKTIYKPNHHGKKKKGFEERVLLGRVPVWEEPAAAARRS